MAIRWRAVRSGASSRTAATLRTYAVLRRGGPEKPGLTLFSHDPAIETKLARFARPRRIGSVLKI